MEKDSNDLWLNPKKPYSIAHRGASTYYHENTLESFLCATELGADFWEVDIQITKDNFLVVFHDSILPSGENIINLYFSEIRNKLPINSAPLFEDVLKLAIKLNTGIYLDIKAKSAGENILKILKKYNYSKIIIGSFNIQLIRDLKNIGHSYPSSILVPPGFDPFEYSKSVEIIHLCWEKLNEPEKLLDNNFFNECKKNNKQVVLWHEENPRRMNKLRCLPLLGICSNQPELVNPIFVKNDKWPVNVVCHRGLNKLAPENSIASTLLAFGFGFSHVEIDVRETLDNELVVLHDKTLNRTSNIKGEISKFNSNLLNKIDLGEKYNSSFTNQPLPLLKQIIEIAVLYEQFLYVEIKEAEVDRVMRLIDNYNYLHKCLFWSEDKKIIKDIINCKFKIKYMLRRQDFNKLEDIIEYYNPHVIEYTINDDLNELLVVQENKIKTMIAYMGANEKIFDKIIKLKVDYVNIDQPILFSKLYKKQFEL